MEYRFTLKDVEDATNKRLGEVERSVRFWVRNDEARKGLLKSIRSLVDYGREYGKQEAAS